MFISVHIMIIHEVRKTVLNRRMSLTALFEFELLCKMDIKQ